MCTSVHLKVVVGLSLLFSVLVKSDVLDGLVVVVITQNNDFHVALANNNLRKIREDLQALHVENSVVVASHQLDLHGDAWTIAPLFKPLASYKEAKWFLFVMEETQVNFTVLTGSLARLDSSQELFLGHGLSDEDHVITHHFAPPQSLLYPHLACGFLLSGPALVRASRNVLQFKESFNIDAGYELALFLKFHRLTKQETGPSPPLPPSTSTILTHLPALCLALPPFPDDGSCATLHRVGIAECGGKDRVMVKDVHWAVKTCHKFHKTRLPVVWKTWARDLDNVIFYSDVEDANFSTVYSGLPNTEVGHCGKTVAIIRRFHALSETMPLKWLVVADDDTLLSVPRLLRLLRCYSHTHPLLLGEVYGYEAHTDTGYSYVTGGGGMVLSARAAASFVESGMDCPAPNHPDDMYLGAVAKRLEWGVVHSPLFHQSQPPTFPKEVLQLEESISFHRHAPLDPGLVYTRYLLDHAHQDGGDEGTAEQTTQDYKSSSDSKVEL